MTKAEVLARAWIQGWIDGTPDDIPLAEEFVHTSPFGTMTGRQAYLDWVKPLAAKNIAELRILKTLGNDREAVIWFEAESPDGVRQTCDWVHTDGARITRIQSFYDASGLDTGSDPT